MLEGHEDGNDIICDGDAEEQLAEENQEERFELEIMLHALTGWSAPKTMRLVARIGSHEIIVLIDSGSTHNFISEKLANELQLLVVPIERFTVQVANRDKLKCQGHFEEVWVDLQGTIFSLTLYSLPLTGMDLVLGIQWLEMLGSVVCNWKQLTMEFRWENQIRKLQGVDDGVIKVASLKEL